MVFTNLSGLNYTPTPITNISPLTYRDGATFLEYLETIKQYINDTLVPDSDAMIANAITSVNDVKADWDAKYTEIMNNLAAQIALLNESAVTGMVGTGTVHDGIVALIDSAVDTIATTLRAETTTATSTLDTTLRAKILADITAAKTELYAAITALEARLTKDVVRDWIRAGLETSVTNPFRIVFTGDSHTQGGDRNYNVRLADLLTTEVMGTAQGSGSTTGNAGAGVHTWSAAWPGQVSGNYVSSGVVNNVAVINPELVFHMIGTNDFINQTAPATYKANVLKALNDIWAVAPNARQVLITVWSVANPAVVTYPWAQYLSAMRDIKTQLAGDTRFELFDFGSKLNRSGSAALTPWTKLLFDGIHGTQDLHKVLTEELATWIGLPSPQAAYGSTRTYVGSAIQAGVRLPSNVASTVTLEPAPVLRTVTIHARALVDVAAESAFYLQIDETNGTVLNFPNKLQAGPTRSVEFSMVLDVDANQKRIFGVAGEPGISFVAGGDNDYYNQFWIEVSYT